jgi:CHAT domain-containing protein
VDGSVAEAVHGKRIDGLIAEAASAQSAGEAEQSYALLQEALSLAKRSGDSAQRALVLGSLSDVHLRLRQLDDALVSAERGIASARACGAPAVTAAALNFLGNAESALKRYPEAMRAYREGLDLAERSADTPLAISLMINALHAQAATGSDGDALPLLEAALAQVQSLRDTASRASRLLALGSLAQQLSRLPGTESGRYDSMTLTMLAEARSLAKASGDSRSLSHAEGLWGEWELARGHPEEAELHLRQALFFADQADAPELSARWHAATGRLREAARDPERAKLEYGRALEAMKPIRAALVFGHRGFPETFQDTVQSTYLRLATLLLQDAAKAASPAATQPILKEIRDTLEGLRGAELQDYFQDECVTALQERRSANLHNRGPEPGTAILYTVSLRDRLVLLANFTGDELAYAEVPLQGAELAQTLAGFRKQLSEIGNPRRLRVAANTLYEWLIKPIRPALDGHRVNTVVVAPDQALRTIPFAALHDGRDFLVSRYAFALSPGLSLTEAGSADTTSGLALVGGLSESVQGFEGLPHVDEELGAASRLYEGERFVNETFLKKRVQTALERTPYGIVTFATHARIERDPRQSFLLTYDGRISLDELQDFVRISRFRKEPVDLLVLSACDTAEGDDRAALGLAGVAVKAGARSVMASLWSVSDASTAELVPLFLEKIKDRSASKAQALQSAQRHLLADSHYGHPYYWAPFVLIGNWR